MSNIVDKFHVDTTGIKTGDIYKNYSLLCQALNQKSKTGESKVLQLKNWERFFKYHKKGHKFIIDEIYKKPFPKPSHGNQASHINVSKLCLIRLLEENNNHLVMSKSKMARSLKYVNDDFYRYYNDQEKLARITDIKEIQVADFMNTTTSAYKNSIDTILRTMSQEGIISVEIKKFVENSYIEIMPDGSKKTKYEHREATPYEIECFLNIQASILDYYNVSSVQQVYELGKRGEFKAMMEEQLLSQLGIRKVYDCFDIRSTDVTIDRGYTLELGEDYKNSNVFNEFLKLWVSNRMNRIDTGIERSKKLYSDSEKRETMSAAMESRRDFSYKDNMSKLIKMLIINGN